MQKYIETPVKKNKNIGRDATLKVAEQVSTPLLVWLIVKRHKVGLLGIWAVVMTALYIFPPLPNIILGMF